MKARSRRAVLALSVSIPGLGLVLGGCGTTFPGATLSEQVAGWAKTTGYASAVRTIEGDLRRVESLVAAKTPGSIRTDCDVLVTDALSANQNLPTPDPTLTALLGAAYGAAGAAGHDCFEGADGDVRLLARSATARAKAATDLIRAQARFDSVTTGFAGGP